MAMFRAVLSLAVTATLVEFAMGANYTVGGTNGWDITSNLQAWAAAQTFHVGDNLVFQYSRNHNVLEVTKSDYDSCQATSAVQAHADGNTLITLATPGKRYFTCGVPGHCTQGMKLQVNTLATSVATTPSPTKATSPPTLPKIASPPLPVLGTPLSAPPLPELGIPPLPAVATAPSTLPKLATPPLPGIATLAPSIPPSLAPLGSLPSGLPPTLPSVESPAVDATSSTLPPPSASSANGGHLLLKRLSIGIYFGMTMLLKF